MKISKKISSIVLLLIVLLSTNIFAATTTSDKVSLEIVENNICTINITDNAVFEKKLIDYDLEKKELTLGLKISNNAIAPLDKSSEIVLVIDNSLSMGRTISTGGSRMEAVTDSAKLLASELLKLDTVKLSVISFSTGPDEGTITDATLRTPLTNSESAVMDAITAVSEDATGARTNIEAGITLASQQFTGTCESQFIILLTDGVPNVSLGSNKIQYSGITAENTRNALINTSQKGIEILSMMTGLTDDIDSQTGKTLKELAEEIFGTPASPTVGKFYYITDNEIEETVSKTILTQLIAPEDDLLTDIDIYDYFPQEIVNNFNFEYVTSPNLGSVSEDIDLQNNMIVWHIDKLGYGETGTLSYKLTLKDEISTEIIDMVLDTNEKVDITTEKVLNDDGTKKLITSDITPKVKVFMPVDQTVAEDPIPQTGTTIAIYVIISIAVLACIVIGIKVYLNHKEMKQ